MYVSELCMQIDRLQSFYEYIWQGLLDMGKHKYIPTKNINKYNCGSRDGRVRTNETPNFWDL